jgi:hypothetical protein
MADCRKQHATLCEAWLKAFSQSMADTLRVTRLERIRAIREKLEALGYVKDLASLDRRLFEKHDLVFQAQPLTPLGQFFIHLKLLAPNQDSCAVWSRIKDPLIRMMDEARETRCKLEHAALVVQQKPTAVAVLRQFKSQRISTPRLWPAFA